MGYLGRFQLGDFLPIPMISRNASEVATTPSTTGDTAPCASVFIGATKIESVRLPVADPIAAPGYFHYPLPLGSAYSTGMGCVTVTAGNQSRAFFDSEEHTFQIVDGGNANGTVVALEELERPNGEFAVGEYAIGTVFQGRNPY